MSANDELVKLKLTPAQRDLIYINITRLLNCDNLSTRHHKTFNNLEERGIFVLDDNIDVQFTAVAKRRLLKIGIDICGSEEIKALKFDPIFLEYKKHDKKWADHCLKPHGASKAERQRREELSDKIFNEYQRSVENADCVFRTLRNYVSEFMKGKKIPRTI
jgi:hypothetical protein